MFDFFVPPFFFFLFFFFKDTVFPLDDLKVH